MDCFKGLVEAWKFSPRSKQGKPKLVRCIEFSQPFNQQEEVDEIISETCDIFNGVEPISSMFYHSETKDFYRIYIQQDYRQDTDVDLFSYFAKK